MLHPVATDPLPACDNCGRASERLFPRDKVGQVCGSCYESLGRMRPEWSRLEVLGVFGLLIGSALLMIALIGLLVR